MMSIHTCNLTLEVFRTPAGWILFSGWRNKKRFPKRRNILCIHGGTFLSSGVRKCMLRTRTVITNDSDTRNIENAKYIPVKAECVKYNPLFVAISHRRTNSNKSYYYIFSHEYRVLCME